MITRADVHSILSHSPTEALRCSKHAFTCEAFLEAMSKVELARSTRELSL